jgi:hypothetical protein
MNTIRNHAVKAIAVALTAAIVLVGNPLTTRANGGGKKSTSLTDAQVSVKYEGTKDNSIVFKVDFENPTGEKFWLIIKNDNGDIFYHQQFSETHFSKSVLFDNTDSDIHPTFVIRAGDSNSEIVREFQVSKTLIETTLATSL